RNESSISNITRHKLIEALDGVSLAGSRDLIELLREHWPAIDEPYTDRMSERTLADDIYQHAIRNSDWDNSFLLERVGFLACSQARVFRFLEDVLDPIRRNEGDRERVISLLNPILHRDGFYIGASGHTSGYVNYRVRETSTLGVQPADELISQVLVVFDEAHVHEVWTKALQRRISDPEGAITAARALLEAVCKHIIEESGGNYGSADDLPKLYRAVAEK